MTLLIVLALVAAAVIAFAITKKKKVEVVEQAPIVPVKKELTLTAKKQPIEKKAEVKEKKPKSKKTTKKEK